MPTLHVCSLSGATCQVTKQGVSIGGIDTASWQAEGGRQTTVAVDDGGRLLVATDGGSLHLFEATSGLTSIASAQLPNEISCAATHTFPSGRKIAAVCTWASHELILLSLPDLQIITSLALDTAFLPRSIVTSTFNDNIAHLFIGLGDGTLVTFVLDENEQTLLRPDSKKAVTLGQRPISMAPFVTEEGAISVLVCSDRPTVVSRTSGRLSYASVNMRVSGRLTRSLCVTVSTYLTGC